ncbi:DUF1801 domain-containing protein [Rhodohalobacter sp. 8-1]|uniref:DUF1801 domain-containing protein n=1 Tax=Rhodohalobacter sp. 8-1 TaxID=3131972 RepID=UPI0030EE2825
MISKAESPEEYIRELPDDRRPAMEKLRTVILENLPSGFEERMSYEMIGYVVPHSVYPDGYHTDPTLPLPFMSIASQKNHIALYHMGLYNDEELLKWFKSEFPNHTDSRLDMEKSCVRFKNPDNIPFELIGELSRKMSAEEWVELYEESVKP